MVTPLAKEHRINTDNKLNARVRRIADRLVKKSIVLRPEICA
jgi:hypothetical protein